MRKAVRQQAQRLRGPLESPDTVSSTPCPFSLRFWPGHPAVEPPPFCHTVAPAGRLNLLINYPPSSLLRSSPFTKYRSQRKPAPSPLHTSTAISPPTSATPSGFSFPFPNPQPNSSPRGTTGGSQEHLNLPQIVTTGPESPRPERDQSVGAEKTYFNSDSSGASTPVEEISNPMFVPHAFQPTARRSLDVLCLSISQYEEAFWISHFLVANGTNRQRLG